MGDDGRQTDAKLARFAERVEDNPDLKAFCFDDSRRTEMLRTLLAGSAFVSDILIRNPGLFREFADAQVDARMRLRASEKTAVEMERAVHLALENADTYSERKSALRKLHRNELFRIAASDLLGFWDMPAVTRQLSMLAGSMIRAAVDVAAAEVEVVPAGLAIVGMGKLGGRELNYSSDIDLIFVAGSDAMRYSRLGERVIDVLGGITADGFLYRVDMRLRPWGRSGALVHTVDAYEKYLKTHGEGWEKQALIKARVLAGNTVVGDELAERLAPIVFQQDPEVVREDIRRMKGRIETELAKKGQTWGNVKQGRGSIRDVEFTVQYLQLANGWSHPGIRSPSTLEALTALFEHDLLTDDDYRVLTEGYTFLRVVEHHLQLYDNRQTHALPRETERLEDLASRLEFSKPNRAAQLVEAYEMHATAIRKVFERIIENGSDSDTGPDGRDGHLDSALTLPPLESTMAPEYREIFTRAEIERHAVLSRRLSREHPVTLDVRDEDDGMSRLTIVGFNYLGALSAISGLLLAYGFDIVDGQVFTDEQRGDASGEHPKIVDVFKVRPVRGEPDRKLWTSYENDLELLMLELASGRKEDVQGNLAERVAQSRERGTQDEPPSLYPVDIVVDNESDDRFTVLHIEAPDTVGFLYELTNALSLLNVDISRVAVASAGTRVRDTLHVTDSRGGKITDGDELDRLRLATVLVQHFTHLLPLAPNPTAALLKFRSLLGGLLTRPGWIQEITSLERPDVLDALTRLLGVSDFLWNDFLRMHHETLSPLVGDLDLIQQPRLRADVERSFEEAISAARTFDERIEALNQLKDSEMFRIDMRYILGQTGEFGQFSRELTDLGEVVVNQALRISLDEVRSTAGLPMFEDGGVCPLAVFALGKFGGREMGFASDIELLFVYEASGRSSGASELTNAQYFDRVAQHFLNAIQSKREGVFEIDLRLRPYGSASSLATSIATFQRYFDNEGPAWPYERQLLIKLRPVAGDSELSDLVMRIRKEILGRIGMFDAGSMRAMRERQLRHLVTPGKLNAKYSPGGLVDIEYLTQALQISYAHRHPDLLDESNTRLALGMLAEREILLPDDHSELVAALILLRRVIDGLRMVRGNAKDLNIPDIGTQEMLYLSRRLDRGSAQDLTDEILTRMGSVAGISAKLLA